jgi:XisH protein
MRACSAAPNTSAKAAASAPTAARWSASLWARPSGVRWARGSSTGSGVESLEQAVGQHVLYRALLAARDPGRLLFLAVPDDVWNTLFQEPLGETALQAALDRVLCFDAEQERIIRWTPPPSGET